MSFSQKAALRAVVVGIAFATLGWWRGWDEAFAHLFGVPIEASIFGLWLAATATWHAAELRNEATRRVADGEFTPTRR